MYNLFGEATLNTLINNNDKHKINGLAYIPNFVSKKEQDFLLAEIDKKPWLSDLKRRVQHYGYKYDYKLHKINIDMKIDELPNWLMEFAIRLKREGLFKHIPDQVIINEYIPGQGISNHIDCPPCFSDTVASLSLGSQCVMNFTNIDNKYDTVPYLLEEGSLIVLKEDARYCWMHGIKMVKSDKYYNNKIVRKRRVSLTFRKVLLEN